MMPGDRPWYWWSAQICAPTEALVIAEVDGWPTALGALRWLLTAAGATQVDILDDM